jgi:hypothetical protein
VGSRTGRGVLPMPIVVVYETPNALTGERREPVCPQTLVGWAWRGSISETWTRDTILRNAYFVRHTGLWSNMPKSDVLRSHVRSFTNFGGLAPPELLTTSFDTKHCGMSIAFG